MWDVVGEANRIAGQKTTNPSFRGTVSAGYRILAKESEVAVGHIGNLGRSAERFSVSPKGPDKPCGRPGRPRVLYRNLTMLPGRTPKRILYEPLTMRAQFFALPRGPSQLTCSPPLQPETSLPPGTEPSPEKVRGRGSRKPSSLAGERVGLGEIRSIRYMIATNLLDLRFVEKEQKHECLRHWLHDGQR